MATCIASPAGGRVGHNIMEPGEPAQWGLPEDSHVWHRALQSLSKSDIADC